MEADLASGCRRAGAAAWPARAARRPAWPPPASPWGPSAPGTPPPDRYQTKVSFFHRPDRQTTGVMEDVTF